jgi:mannose-6-phosphate isomerase-like protein (cupin superfamily)
MRHITSESVHLLPIEGSVEKMSILVGRHAKHGSSKTHTVAIIELAPGASSDPHFHKEREESYYFIEGRGRSIVDQQVVSVKKGDLIHTFPGEQHSFVNTEDLPLRYLVITAPAWVPTDSWKK